MPNPYIPYRQPRVMCVECCRERTRRYFADEQWESDEPCCLACWEKFAKSKTKKAWRKRRDRARQVYCRREDPDRVLGIMCAKYLKTCGETCYTEDENFQPNCFVHPGERSEHSLQAVDYSSDKGYIRNFSTDKY